jgi:plastocyanin
VFGNSRHTTVGIVGALLCAVALVSCGGSAETPHRPRAKTHTVIMEGMVFQPNMITVAAGDTIVWVNKDMVPHSATSNTAGFDSKVIQANASWQTRMERPGDFDYVCSFHPMMTAKLQVR